MTHALQIRGELPGDVAGIDEVNRLAFGRDSEAGLVAALRQLPGFEAELSLAAVTDGYVVGHILFSPVVIRQTSGATVAGLALAPMAVRPERQRQGIGSQLVAAGLAACRQSGTRPVIVVGHPEFYPRFGFQPARARGLEVPFAVRDAAFMVYEAASDAALINLGQSPQSIAGMVEYPAPFLAV